MDEKTMEQMAKMVDAVQPHCDEEIVAAMTCSHAGSMGSGLLSKLLGIFGGGAKTKWQKRYRRFSEINFDYNRLTSQYL